jgi:S-adenosylmethionine:tRNA ribosyltransferase-isomerase
MKGVTIQGEEPDPYTIIDFNFMLTTELDYALPADLIAQTPSEPRDTSRLMLIDRATQSVSHRKFWELPQLLNSGDLLVANDSRVIPARLFGHKPSGGKVEILLLRKLDNLTWRGLVGGRHVQQVDLLVSPDKTLHATVTLAEGGADWLLRFDEPIDAYLNQLGVMPLPPYIHTHLQDAERYQTVYARLAGSAAAPTAGLHFTPQLVQRLAATGIGLAFVTLHIGLDTFKPISEDRVENHQIHSEWCELPVETARAMAQAKGAQRRVVAVGTTSVRVLESAASQPGSTPGSMQPFSGFTQLYITPGYTFKAVDALITNFHLPKSTLLAMIGAFMGMDLMRAVYAEAIREGYRFYSFGDAMLIL